MLCWNLLWGNKRKLSTAIAFIGNPAVVFLVSAIKITLTESGALKFDFLLRLGWTVEWHGSESTSLFVVNDYWRVERFAFSPVDVTLDGRVSSSLHSFSHYGQRDVALSWFSSTPEKQVRPVILYPFFLLAFYSFKIVPDSAMDTWSVLAVK